MQYTFEILGVSPILSFLNHQIESPTATSKGAEYLSTYQCTLDALLESVEPVPPKRGWDLDKVVDTVVHYWLQNSDRIQHWKERLQEAGSENILVSRIADLQALQQEFDGLLGKNF
jgi:hypothetical protein